MYLKQNITDVTVTIIFLLVGTADAFFRVNCGKIQTGRIDPIVNPGAVAAHSHTIVGASNVGVNSTYASLLNSECTSCEVTPDKSAYWTPNLYYEHPNGTFEEVPHTGSVIYYLGRGLNGTTIPFPKGFQMLSGNKAIRAYNQTGMTWGNASYPSRPIADAISFACLSDPLGPETVNMVNVTTCINGMRAQVHFQTCWNGIDLYKADNSHVAHLSQIDNGICPPGYPYLFPHLFMETNYAVLQVSNYTDGGRYVFSQGDPTGYGFHGDFMNGWDSATLQTAIDTCVPPGDDDFGTIDDCPILLSTANTQAAINCPQRPPQIQEQVTGLLDKLPGCVTVVDGPHAATAAQLECPAGVAQPSISKTVDSVPIPTYSVAIGASFGNKYNRFVGCGNDSYGSPLRTLNAVSTTNENMSVEYCQTYCTGLGYPYSGVEDGTQCYCDLAVNPSARFDFSGNYTTGCITSCPGNRSEWCGGPFYMDVYNNTDPRLNITNNTAGSTLQLTVAPAAYASTYVGCAAEGATGRALNGSSQAAADMTVGRCAAFCRSANYALYGLEYASQCFCGNGLASGAAVVDEAPSPASGSVCSMRCAGNFSQVCGGSGALSVYNNTQYVKQAVTASVGKYFSKQCLTEPAGGGRALNGAMMASDSMTPNMCVKFCLGKQYHYAGVEFGTQCFCDNKIAAGAKSQTCDVNSLMSCPGNKYTYCGAGNLLNLYYSATL
ncbi:hypothetical protein MBLNU459_g5419t1 [Dothideomycetes sp. NU459]